jgi:alpha/beta superfamily hydrolase
MRDPALEVFHFGSPPTRKLGCVELPARGVARRRAAVVLVPPWGHEAVRAHRAYRRLAGELAALGFGVLRFDLSGTGDSEGGEELWGLETWTGDVAEAVGQARGRLGGESAVCLIGGRLGAALAVRAVERLTAVAALVLWDPVLSGAAYLAELDQEHRRVLATAHVTPSHGSAAVDHAELLGFPVPASFRRDLGMLAVPIPILDAGSPHGRPMGRPSASVLTVHTADTGDGEAPWTWVEDVARAVLPLRAIREIATWVGATCP